MPSDPQYYLDLITSEHDARPKFMAMCQLFAQYFADNQMLLANIASAYDVDEAVGEQLDQVGIWVGASRILNPAINGMVSLSDDDYRLLIKAIIAINSWDGTIPGAYTVWDNVFGIYGFKIRIQDNQDMSMLYIFDLPNTVSPVFKALIQGGYVGFRPAGVKVIGNYQPSVPGSPVFGFGRVQNDKIAGFGVGVWMQPLA